MPPKDDPVASQDDAARDEEARYRSALALDPEAHRDELLARLSDPNWRVRKAAIERLCASRSPRTLVDSLLGKLSTSGDVGGRNAAAEALARIGAQAVEGLVESLSAPDSQVRKLAADVLGEVGEARAAAALVASLEDPDGNVRAAAAEALGKVGGEGAAPALERAIARGDRMLALAALESLSRLGRRPPVDVLCALAQDPYLRRSALRLLGAIPGRASLELISQGLLDPSRGVREAAFEALALARSSGAQPVPELVRALVPAAPIAERAREALACGSTRAVEGALCALGLSGEPGDAPEVVKAAVRESLGETALSALRALGPRAADALLKALPELTDGARALAIDAFARLQERAAVPALVDLALSRDAAEPERARAVEVLGKLGDARAIAPLSLLLEDPATAAQAARSLVELGRRHGTPVQEACRRIDGGPGAGWALRVLGELGSPEDFSRFEGALLSSDPELRRAAVEAAGARAPSDAEPLLCRALEDASAPVRAAAARGLSRCCSDQAVRALLVALDDADPQVACRAAEALGALGAAKAVEPLRRALARGEGVPSGPEVLLAIAALRALARLGAATPELLLGAAGHADAEVAKEVVRVASELAGAGRVLLAAARHPRWDARRAAARALAGRRERELLAEVMALGERERDPLAAEAFEEARRALEALEPARGT